MCVNLIACGVRDQQLHRACTCTVRMLPEVNDDDVAATDSADPED
jgi:hypothetical protein